VFGIWAFGVYCLYSNIQYINIIFVLDFRMATTSDDTDNVIELDILSTSTNEATNSNKRARNRHPIWDFFEVTDMNVRCTVANCKSTFKAPSTTSVLKKHLRETKDKRHQEKYSEFMLKEKYDDEKNGGTTKKARVEPFVIQQPDIKTALQSVHKYAGNSERYINIFIIINYIPISKGV
jgi:hypothetical protein